jgi:hypothetical protein
MLSVAKALCQGLLGGGSPVGADLIFDPSFGYLQDAFNHDIQEHTAATNGSLLTWNGDAELWLKLCTLNNPPPIRVLDVVEGALPLLNQRTFATAGGTAIDFDRLKPNFPYNLYPIGTKVGNDRGGVDPCLTGQPGCDVPSVVRQPNLWPWCVYDNPNHPQSKVTAEQKGWPICPPLDILTADTGTSLTDQANSWAVRGAINAGLSVFLYLQWLETQSQPPPDYNECTLLP